ncbi:hypothetical protein KUTeg_004322 [Tegillarca granosa]|uniref:Uncharacterized protein n=1 Tax=Tegillarca granosa TaxID=220873 RepID=A0ABQ9FR65_TEGGR|nr:hypothetical protein KUTeg_004322 [Tegillarca granosa]
MGGTSSVQLAMLGLDSAGKTTLLYRLKFDQYTETSQTIGFNCEKIMGVTERTKGILFKIWDAGGQDKIRPLWRSYTSELPAGQVWSTQATCAVTGEGLMEAMDLMCELIEKRKKTKKKR